MIDLSNKDELAQQEDGAARLLGGVFGRLRPRFRHRNTVAKSLQTSLWITENSAETPPLLWFTIPSTLASLLLDKAVGFCRQLGINDRQYLCACVSNYCFKFYYWWFKRINWGHILKQLDLHGYELDLTSAFWGYMLRHTGRSLMGCFKGAFGEFSALRVWTGLFHYIWNVCLGVNLF